MLTIGVHAELDRIKTTLPEDKEPLAMNICQGCEDYIYEDEEAIEDGTVHKDMHCLEMAYMENK